MKDRGGLSGSGMFLIELLLAILIFAVAAAVCLQIFVTSHQVSKSSSELNRAVIAAQSGAECFKASGGDLSETADFLGADYSDGEEQVVLYLDDDWDATPKNAFFYIVEITKIAERAGLIQGEVAVSRADGNLIFSIPISVSTEGGAAL